MSGGIDVVVFTDGAAKGNPGPGGWGAVLWIDGATVRELGGHGGATTNNRMELAAPAEALEWLGADAATATVTVRTDSTYVLKGITAWIVDWKKRGWKTRAGGDVANRDLWERLEAAVAGCARVRWERVPGHAGVPGNERADAIASDLAEGRERSLYVGSYEDYGHDLSITAAPGGSSQPGKGGAGANKGAAARGRGRAHSYVSLVDGVVRIHGTWADCERRVKGRSGARYRKALSPSDEKALVAEWGGRLDDPAAGR